MGFNIDGGGANEKTEHLLPILALLTAQLITSSWHVLGKHVMHAVPYLTPISYVFARNGVTSCMLLVLGRIYEGYVPFPPLFRRNIAVAASVGSGIYSVSSMDSENGLGMTLSQSGSLDDSLQKDIISGNNASLSSDKKVDDRPTRQSPQQITSPGKQFRHHHHRPRRRKRESPSFRNQCITFIQMTLQSFGSDKRTSNMYNQQPLKQSLNPEALQIISAGISGMLLLPVSYTTGLLLTSPTVASVWDGPMIPLGCFCAAVGLGVETRSKLWPMGQVGSLILTVGGSLVVLMVDFLGGNSHIKNDATGGGNGSDNTQFIQGNMVLMGVVAAYSATALLQKQLKHYPPMTLTGWMFSVGFIGCFCALLLDSVFEAVGISITGCTMTQAVHQIYRALSTSPTFRYGLLYACFFVGGMCFSIGSYASSHLESSVITLFAASQPPITAVLEYIWEGKGLGWMKLGGMACVGVGMYCFTYIKRVEKENHQHGHATKAFAAQFSSTNGSSKDLHGHTTNRSISHGDV